MTYHVDCKDKGGAFWEIFFGHFLRGFLLGTEVGEHVQHLMEIVHNALVAPDT